MRSRWAVVVLALFPLPFVAWAGGALADRLAKRTAGYADRAARVLVPAPRTTAPETFVEALEAPEPEPEASAPARRAPPPRRGLRVRAETVLRLANGGARPGGIAVPARGARPAGVALVGVSGLGVGLVDGDVLTHADGRLARSPSDVIGAVIGARAHHASEICGRFWRNGETWNLVVEQPYVARRAPTAAVSEERFVVGLAK